MASLNGKKLNLSGLGNKKNNISINSTKDNKEMQKNMSLDSAMSKLNDKNNFEAPKREIKKNEETITIQENIKDIISDNQEKIIKERETYYTEEEEDKNHIDGQKVDIDFSSDIGDDNNDFRIGREQDQTNIDRKNNPELRDEENETNIIQDTIMSNNRSNDTESNKSCSVGDNRDNDDILHVKGKQKEEKSDKQKNMHSNIHTGLKSSELEEDEEDQGSKNNKKGKKEKQKKEKKIKKNKDSLSTDQEMTEYLKKKRMQYIIKKVVIVLLFFSIQISILGFGIYIAMYKKDRPLNEIAAYTNQYNVTTRFPDNGVLGFLQRNIYTFLTDDIILGHGVKSYKVTDVTLKRIIRTTDESATVDFTVTISTDIGTRQFDFMIPLIYDWDKRRYLAAGKLSLITGVAQDDTGIYESPAMSFNEDDEYKANNNKELIDDIKSFMTNFYVLLYNEKKDYHQLYSGDKILGQNNMKFESIDEIHYYKKPNMFGHNLLVRCTFYLESNGMSISTMNYVNIEKNGGTWEIKDIY